MSNDKDTQQKEEQSLEAKRLREERKLREEQEDRAADAEARKVLRTLTSDKDDEHTNVSLRTVLGGDILVSGWFRRQFWFIVLVVVMCIFYISNRYACQKEMIESTKLEDTLLDRRYKALTISSQLKELTRPSVVEEHLSDTALKVSTDPIYSLPVTEEDTAQ